MTKKWEIWAEGFRFNHDEGHASLMGTQEAETFKEACDLLAARDRGFERSYNPDRLTHWGCRLFDNEADARKTFG